MCDLSSLKIVFRLPSSYTYDSNAVRSFYDVSCDSSLSLYQIVTPNHCTKSLHLHQIIIPIHIPDMLVPMLRSGNSRIMSMKYKV